MWWLSAWHKKVPGVMETARLAMGSTRDTEREMIMVRGCR